MRCRGIALIRSTLQALQPGCSSLFCTGRTGLLRYYAESWRKARANEPLEALEQQIASVIGEHPEYQPYFESAGSVVDRDFSPESGEGNPFFHMGMHLALREQLATGRPAGIVNSGRC